MRDDREYIAFDQYQRYRTIERLIDVCRQKTPQRIYRILELGSFENKLLRLFLPNDEITFTDVTLTDKMRADGEFQEADGTDLHFPDGSYDFVVSADVFEHVPKEKRESFLRESYRVAKESVFMCFPIGEKRVEAAEERINAYFRSLSGDDFIWLKEHRENGLPEPDEVAGMVGAITPHFFSFTHGDLLLWEKMWYCRFDACFVPGINDFLEKIDNYYNTQLYANDYSEDCYRVFYVLSHESVDELLRQVRHERENVRQNDLYGLNMLLDVCHGIGPVREYSDACQKLGQDTSCDTQIFVDTGAGFNEEQSQHIYHPYNGTFDLTVPIEPGTERVRVDPSDRSCIVIFKKCCAVTERGIQDITFESDGHYLENAVIFSSDDPQLIISHLPEGTRELRVTLGVCNAMPEVQELYLRQMNLAQTEREQFSERLRAQRESLSETARTELEAERERMERGFQIELEEQEKQFQVRLEERDRGFQAERTLERTGYNVEREQLKSIFMQEREQLRCAFQVEREQMRSAFQVERDQAQNAENIRRSELESRYREDLDAQGRAFQAEHDEIKRVYDEEHTRLTDAHKADLAALEEAFEEERTRSKSAFDAERKQIDDAHELELRRLEKAFQIERGKLVNAVRLDMTEFENKIESERHQEILDFQGEREQLKKAFRRETRQMKSSFNRDQKQLKSVFLEERSRMQSDFQAEQGQIRELLQNELKSQVRENGVLRAQAEELIHANENLRSELEYYKTNYNTAINQLEEHKQLLTGSQTELESIRNSYNAETCQREELQRQLTESRTQIESAQFSCKSETARREELSLQVVDLQRQVEVYRQAYDIISSSEFWRITKPFRVILDVMKKIIERIKNGGLSSEDGQTGIQSGQRWNEQYSYLRFFIEHKDDARFAPEDIPAQRTAVFSENIKFSIVTPLYNTSPQFLCEMIQSVMDQTYGNWELCLADGSDRKHRDVRKICEKFVRLDSRVKYCKLEKNLGISGNTNAALNIADGDYIGLLDHDDVLHPSALYEVMTTICEKGADFVYTDESTFHVRPNNVFRLHFKPDYAPDTLRACNYICHFTVFKHSLLDTVGLFRSECDGSQDYDMVLRLTEKASRIEHIPKILYHWRAHEKSVAEDIEAKPYVINAAHKAISDHLTRVGLKGEVLDTVIPSMYRVHYEIIGNPLVSIMIPNKDHLTDLKKCVDSILQKTTYSHYEIIIIENNSNTKEIFEYYKKIQKKRRQIRVVKWRGEFNYAAINNFGVKYSKGDFILCLNNDTEVISPDWIQEMLMFAQREDVGAVGAKLYYPDETIQHAGVILGVGGVAGHSHKGFARQEYGYIGRLIYAQNLSAVTAACIMIRRSVWDQVRGFDEVFKVALNDVDLCMRIRQAGYLIVWTPFAELYHYESKSRGLENTPEKRVRFEGERELFKERWKAELEAGDPYYNPNLTLDKEDFSFKYIDNCIRREEEGTLEYISEQVSVDQDIESNSECLYSFDERSTEEDAWCIRGWAIAFNKPCDDQKIFISLTNNQETQIYTAIKFNRQDVADYFHDERYLSCGYFGAIPIAKLQNGTYEVGIIIQSESRFYMLSEGPTWYITVNGRKINQYSQYRWCSEETFIGQEDTDASCQCAIDGENVVDGALQITGWAFIPELKSAAQRVVVQLTGEEGERYCFSTRSTSRNDVGHAFNNALYNESGFEAIILAEKLKAGNYTYCIYIVNEGRVSHSLPFGPVRIG